MAPTVGDWVKSQYQQRYCDSNGHLKYSDAINWDKFTKQLVKLRPDQSDAIRTAVQKLQPPAITVPNLESCQASQSDEALEAWVYQQYPECGFRKAQFKGWAKFTETLISFKPSQKASIIATVEKLRKPGSKYSFQDPGVISSAKAAQRKQQMQQGQVKALQGAKQKSQKTEQESEGGVPVHPLPTMNVPKNGVGASTDLPSSVPQPLGHRRVTTQSISPAKLGNHSASSANGSTRPKKPSEPFTASKESRTNNLIDFTTSNSLSIPSTSVPSTTLTDGEQQTPSESSGEGTDLIDLDTDSDDDGPRRMVASDPNMVDYLLNNGAHEDSKLESSTRNVQHAPLFTADILEENKGVLPQYGLLGSHVDSGKRIFHNTNVPFASFVCGVQGSGKSHTTSCLLENALIPVGSGHLGRLENPLSALVFAYDHFNGDGSGFNVSEVVSLAKSDGRLPKHFRVKRVTVLVSPSNPAIHRIYSKLENVTVIPFKLHPRTLTVDTILTLMAVDSSSAPPLYLAQVTKILRDINMANNGRFDYFEFKHRLQLCDFNPAQINMLQLRLDLLESFLDLTGNAPQPKFHPGEVTIMDMSCPFVDANTACVLFKIGLDRYLESGVSGKMVVLDEAHKYMLRVPGATALNDYLVRTIRLQRHKGVRIIIATQEPTLLTDLIALCDVTVMHRFSSPEWFAALKKHIPMSNQDHNLLLEDIESLKPGTALVYSPKAIIGKNDEGALVKGTGQLMKIRIRNRITRDGGRSIMANTNRALTLNGAYR